MDPNLIRRIAGESKERTDERDAIVRKLARLENSARVSKQYATRPHPGKPI